MVATREGYGDAIVEVGERHPNAVVLDADLAKSTRSLKFGKKFPDRFWYMGINEADLISTAAGLALSGKIAFASSFAVFITNNAFDQLKMSVCYSNANVKVIGSHGGLITGQDGPSAQAIMDVSLMRTLPGMTVVVPADYHETKKATHAIAEHAGPCYLRTTREGIPVLFDDSHEFEIGKAQVLEEGSDVCLVACGAMVSEALESRKILAQKKISASVVNSPSIKPLDARTILRAASKASLVVSCEDHSIIGGLGSAVAEALSESQPKKMVRIGVRDVFGESGKARELLEKYGMDSKAIVRAVEKGLKK
ncbi:MAG: transketolase family protein [Candidatus Diapherotrites archaeon]|nr:transketolase family protein [Candidatus Diapherotrites archaeon]